MEHGKSYTDTRYAYYRNEAKSTVCLYGYVKYKGDNEYYYEESHEYPLEHKVHSCPDNNHPHAIDLGLPSGTKWCCMDVGASSPEQYGGYYAWGETSEKSVYGPTTYAYAYPDNDEEDPVRWHFTNIGSDIAGTSYDVAHVKWGGDWRMPTIDEQNELLTKCHWTCTWTTQNGINGFKVMGPNGNSIFLPAAGYRYYDELRSASWAGFYWSSSLSFSSPYDRARDLYLSASGTLKLITDDHRIWGYSVRAVCP